MALLLQNEPGADRVYRQLENCAISTLNLSETIQKSLAKKVNVADAIAALSASGLHIVAFDQTHARLAAELWESTKTFGLSLADRACLTLARELHATAYTADKIWKQAGEKIGVKVSVIR